MIFVSMIPNSGDYKNHYYFAHKWTAGNPGQKNWEPGCQKNVGDIKPCQVAEGGGAARRRAARGLAASLAGTDTKARE